MMKASNASQVVIRPQHSYGSISHTRTHNNGTLFFETTKAAVLSLNTDSSIAILLE